MARREVEIVQQLLTSAFASFCPKELSFGGLGGVHAATIMFLLSTYYVPDIMPDSKDTAVISVTTGCGAGGRPQAADSHRVGRYVLIKGCSWSPGQRGFH